MCSRPHAASSLCQSNPNPYTLHPPPETAKTPPPNPPPTPWHCAGRHPRPHGRVSHSQPRRGCRTSSAARTTQRPRWPSQAPAKTTTKTKSTPRPAPPRAPPHACGRTGAAPVLTARKILGTGDTAGEGPLVYLCMCVYISRCTCMYTCMHTLIRGTGDTDTAGEGPPVYLCLYIRMYVHVCIYLYIYTCMCSVTHISVVS